MGKNATKLFLSVLIMTVLMSVSVFASIDTTDTNTGSAVRNLGPLQTSVMGVNSNTIVVQSKDVTMNVMIPSRNRSYTAGTFKGTQEGKTINFFCIDINTGLQWNSEYEYAGKTSLQLSYVLNNYYPFAGRQFTSGALNLTEQEEAAATQLAIWHYSDGIDITNSTPTKVYQAAQTIIADANANAVDPLRDIVINIPSNQEFKIGEPIKFLVEVYNEYNTPEAGVTVSLSSNSGTLSALNATTNANGVTDTLEITQTNSESATITAKALVTLAAGSKFTKKGAPNSSQKLVLATPAQSEVEVSATVNWYGEPDLTISKTGSSLKVEHGEQVTYTITVTNKASAGASATGVQVSDVLPEVLTNVSSDGDYNPVTGIWNVGDLAVGESKTLTITATVDLATNGNGGIYDLGVAADYNLFVLQNIKKLRSDTEGRVAVGRDAFIEYGYSIADKLPENSGDVLVVGRKLTYKSGRVYHGNIVYGSYIDTTHANLADGTIRKEKNLIDFNNANTYLKALSKQLYALPVNGTVEYDGYGKLTLEGTDPHLNVFLVPKEYMEKDGSGNYKKVVNHHEIIVPEGSVAIVNYAGSEINFRTGGWNVNGVDAAGETSEAHRKAGSKLLLNFWQARTINNTGGIGIIGSILAPNAKLNYKFGVIYGQVIVKEVIDAHQFNWIKFDGEIKLDTVITNTAEILTYNEKSSAMANDEGVNFDFVRMEAAMFTDVEEIDNSDVPTEFELKQNYPNPFNPTTNIKFSVPAEGDYRIVVYNIVGEKVAELVNDQIQPGTYTVNFEANSLSSGIYFYKLEGKNVNITRKMMLVK